MIIPVDIFLCVLRAASSHERLHSAELMLRVVQNLPVRFDQANSGAYTPIPR